MKVNADQHKVKISSFIYGKLSGYDLELNTFSVGSGKLAYGVRAFNDHRSTISDLYDNEDEAKIAIYRRLDEFNNLLSKAKARSA